MSREEVIRIYIAVTNHTVTETDVNQILMTYCMDRGKEYMETAQFVTMLLSYRQYMPFFSEALEWYLKELNINVLYHKDLKTVLLVF